MIFGLLGMYEDITVRKEAEEASGTGDSERCGIVNDELRLVNCSLLNLKESLLLR